MHEKKNIRNVYNCNIISNESCMVRVSAVPYMVVHYVGYETVYVARYDTVQ